MLTDFVSDVSVVQIGSYTYALASFHATSSLYIINITIPASPETVSILTDTDYPHLDRIFRAVPIHIGGYTYAITTSNGANGIEIIDITNPSSPTSTASISGNVAWNLDLVLTQYIWMVNHSFLHHYKESCVSIINITDPNSPHTLINVFDGSEYNVLRGADGITSVEIQLDSPYVLVASRGGDGGVQIMQLDSCHHDTTGCKPRRMEIIYFKNR